MRNNDEFVWSFISSISKIIFFLIGIVVFAAIPFFLMMSLMHDNVDNNHILQQMFSIAFFFVWIIVSRIYGQWLFNVKNEKKYILIAIMFSLIGSIPFIISVNRTNELKKDIEYKAETSINIDDLVFEDENK